MPFAVCKRGGRKLVLAPDGAPMPPAAPEFDSTLIKAIARAFRRQKMLETGRYATIKEIAKAEKINISYKVCTYTARPSIDALAPKSARQIMANA